MAIVPKNDQMKETLKKIREQELIAAQRKKMDDEIAAKRAIAEDELKSGRSYKDERGQDTNRWDEVARHAKEARSLENVMAFNDWRSAMLKLVFMYGKLNKAIAQDMKELRFNVKYALGLNDLVYRGYNKVKDKMGRSPEELLPELKHTVSFNDDNEIVFDKLEVEATDGTELQGQLDPLFQQGIKLWLSQFDYKPMPDNPNKFIDGNGKELTKDQFNDLKNDPKNGLDAFLSGHFDLNISERPSPGPGR